jgi:hypothetical protein
MNVWWSIVIVAAVLAAAAYVTYLFNQAKLLEIIIGVASTFAGVFLGLGLDNVKKSHEERDLALATLRAETIVLTEEMGFWYPPFPAIALTTPDPDQRRILLEQFQKYLAQKPLLEVPSITVLSNAQVNKSFDELFLAVINHYGAQLKNASQVLKADTSRLEDRYRAYQNVLTISSSVYSLMCMEASLLNGDATQDDFAAYLTRTLAPDRAQRLGCLAPQWGTAGAISAIQRAAQGRLKGTILLDPNNP